MLEVAGQLLPPLAAGERVALATSVDITGSSPHLVGTSLAVTGGGAVLGELSGGCVDAAALEGCRAALAGAAPVAARFGFGDADGARAGLSCGGELDVLVHALSSSPALLAELAAAAAGRAAALGVVVTGPAALLGALVCVGEGAGLAGELADAELAAAARPAVAAQAATGRTGTVEVGCGASTVRLLVETTRPAPRMVLVGATALAAALASTAATLGYAVSVVEPRPAFARPERVPAAVEVVCALPHTYLARTALDERSVVCLLSHDEELDPLALAAVLERDVAYVGALGSRATHARRLERLAAFGVPAAGLDRLHAPIGLDLGASTAAETAVSILAEVVAARTGAPGGRLTGGRGPIHRPRAGSGAALSPAT